MDIKNRYHTDSTYLHERLEHIMVVVIAVVLTLAHFNEINWWRFIASFLILDLVGYIPGALAFRRHDGGRISPVYHHLYNITHSYLTAALLVGAWALALGRFEWAMMAFPIHLSGDRGLFGNIFKPPTLYFEPVAPSAGQAIGRASEAD